MVSISSTAWKVVNRLGVGSHSSKSSCSCYEACWSCKTVNYPGHIPLSSLENALFVVGINLLLVFIGRRDGNKVLVNLGES
jgi:hypothetical protein